MAKLFMDKIFQNRIWHSFMLCLINGSGERANYLRRKHVFGSIGENCTIMDRKVPLYANLIRLGNNVHIASKVSFVTHDALHLLLNNLRITDSGGVPMRFPEKIGCIEIGNNVFVGSNSTILYNVKIGSNVVIGAGCLVNRDVPDNSVVVGVPARIIGSFDDFVNKRKSLFVYPEELKPMKRICSEKLSEYMWQKFNNDRGRAN